MITVKNLSKHFGGIKAVGGVDLHIERGSITGLVGPNGAGKSTLLKSIAGILKPRSGEIFFDGGRSQKKKLTRLCDLESVSFLKNGLYFRI